MKAKRLLSGLLAAGMLFGLTSCGSPAGQDSNSPSGNASEPVGTNSVAPADPGQPEYGGTLTLSYNDFNTVFDPAMGEQYTYSLWLEYLFAPNWGLDDLEAYPFKTNSFTLDTAQGQIAESWKWDAETMTFTVTIRDDVYFQEKEEQYDIFHARNLTAEDVKYSYDRVTGLGSGFDESNMVVIDANWRDRLNMLESVEVLDTYVVAFHMNTASETKLSEFVIAQVNITGPEWDTLTEDQKLDWHYACGTGPYMLTDYVADNHYTFIRNENYYDYDERYPENKLPYLDGVVLQKYGDTTAILSDFIAGKLDYINMNAGLSDSEATQLTSSAQTQAYQFDAAAEAIGLKMNQEPFHDIRVRIAMQKAINLEEVATAYYGYDELTLPGLWDPALTSWSTVGTWDDELMDEYTYDPEGAKQLLAEAGYPDGFSFTVAIDAMANPEIFELAKGYFAEVGIDMEITILSDMSEGRQVQSSRDDPRQYNLQMGTGADAGFVFQTYATTGFAYCNFADDTHFDELLVAVRDAMTTDEQAAAARACEEYYIQNHVLIALSGMTQSQEYYSTRVGGMENGELLSAYHFFKTMSARIWNTEANG